MIAPIMLDMLPPRRIIRRMPRPIAPMDCTIGWRTCGVIAITTSAPSAAPVSIPVTKPFVSFRTLVNPHHRRCVTGTPTRIPSAS